jgi:hypothetical protein
MKLKIYIMAIMATLFVASANSQEMLVDGTFPTFSHTSFSVYWPDGWTFAGTDAFTTAAGVATMTANSSKRIEFEDYNDGVASFREAYQMVNLGIGDFQVTANAQVNEWDKATPYHIVVTDANNKVVSNLDMAITSGYANFGPALFTTTTNGTYKFSLQCNRTVANGWSNCLINSVSLLQNDGSPYVSGGTTAIREVNSKLCNAKIVEDKIVLNSEEIISNASLVSMNGSVISKININKNSFEMAKPQQKGIYFVMIQTPTQSKTIKLNVN